MGVAEVENAIAIDDLRKVWEGDRTGHQLNIERIAPSVLVQSHQSSAGMEHRYAHGEDPTSPQRSRAIGTKLGLLGFHDATPLGPDLSHRGGPAAAANWEETRFGSLVDGRPGECDPG